MSKNCYMLSSDNELYHWKYIKKTRGPNGKFRYYYDWDEVKDDLGVDERQEYKELSKAATRGSKSVTDARAKYVKATERQNRHPNSASAQKKYEERRVDLRSAQIRYSHAKKSADIALQRYYSTPLGKIAKSVDSGKKAFKNLFNRTPIWSGTDAAKRRTSNKG